MRIWFLLLCCFSSVVSATASAATFFGLDAGYQYWLSDADGRVGSKNLSSDFKWSDEGQQSLFLALEHPIPLLPNILLRYNELEGGDNVDDIRVGITTLSGRIKLNLDNTDVVLYWELLDNWVNLDLGVNAKYVNGRLSGRSTSGESARVGIDSWLPLLYIAPRFKLPFTRLSIGGDINWVNFNDYDVFDSRIDLRWEPLRTPVIDVGLDAGYRFIRVDVEDFSGFDGDIDFDGPYLGLYLHF